MGLNFISISLDSSYVKKSIFGPIPGGTRYPPLGPLFLFFLLFFLPFFVFFLAFHFHFFSCFLFISSFFYFLMFFMFFIFFLKKKVSFFLFSCKSSGSQEYVGKKKGPPRRAPSRCSDVLPPSRMSSANNVLAQEPSLRPSSCRRARRRDPGKAKDSTFPGPSSCPRESPTLFSIRSNHGKTSKRCIWLHVVPIRMSPWMTDDDPLIKIDNAAALSTNEATENSGTGPGSS